MNPNADLVPHMLDCLIRTNPTSLTNLSNLLKAAASKIPGGSASAADFDRINSLCDYLFQEQLLPVKSIEEISALNYLKSRTGWTGSAILVTGSVQPNSDEMSERMLSDLQIPIYKFVPPQTPVAPLAPQTVAPPAPVSQAVAPPAPVSQAVAPPAPASASQAVAPPAPASQTVAPPAPASQTVAPPIPASQTVAPPIPDLNVTLAMPTPSVSSSVSVVSVSSCTFGGLSPLREVTSLPPPQVAIEDVLEGHVDIVEGNPHA